MDTKKKLIERLEDKLLLDKKPNLVLYEKLMRLLDNTENLENKIENIDEFLKDKKKIKELFAPVKGVDYFTEKEIAEIIKICTPVKGVDFFDGEKGKDGKDGKLPETEYNELLKAIVRAEVAEGKAEILIEKAKNIKDGKDGKDGKAPEHEWEGTKLRIKHPNGRWGKWVDLSPAVQKAIQMYGGGSGIKVGSAGTKFTDTAEYVNFQSGLTVTAGTNKWQYDVVNPYTYPTLTGEANKVLAVKADESGVEWKDDASGVTEMTALTDYPLTTGGDLLIADGSADPNRIAGNTTTTTKFLSQTGDGADVTDTSWSEIAHNDTTGLQGGTTDEYYHLTSSEASKVAEIDSELIIGSLELQSEATVEQDITWDPGCLAYAENYYSTSYLPIEALYHFYYSSGTAWISAEAATATDTWWALELPTAKVSEKIAMVPKLSYPQYCWDTFTLEGSNNSTDGSDGDWTSLYSGSMDGTASVQFFTFTNTTAYKWWRVTGPRRLVAAGRYRIDMNGFFLFADEPVRSLVQGDNGYIGINMATYQPETKTPQAPLHVNCISNIDTDIAEVARFSVINRQVDTNGEGNQWFVRGSALTFANSLLGYSSSTAIGAKIVNAIVSYEARPTYNLYGGFGFFTNSSSVQNPVLTDLNEIGRLAWNGTLLLGASSISNTTYAIMNGNAGGVICTGQIWQGHYGDRGWGNIQATGGISMHGTTADAVIRTATNSDANATAAQFQKCVVATPNSAAYGYSGSAVFATGCSGDGQVAFEVYTNVYTNAGKFTLGQAVVDTIIRMYNNHFTTFYSTNYRHSFTVGGTDNFFLFQVYSDTQKGAYWNVASGSDIVTISSTSYGATYNYVKIGDSITINGETKTIIAVPSSTTFQCDSTFAATAINQRMTGTANRNFVVAENGLCGVNVSIPYAFLHLGAGNVNYAAVVMDSGTLLTTPKDGAIERTTDNLYFTINTGTARKGVVLDDGTTLDSSYLPYGTTNGRITTATATANIKIKNDTDNTLQLDNGAWEDLRVPATTTKLGGSKDPTFSVFKTNGSGSQGVFTYWFSDSTEQEVYFAIQFPHSWDGGDIKPHVHWTPETTADGDPANQVVEWGLEYTWIDIGGDFANTSIVYTTSTTPADADVVAGRHYMSMFADITPSTSQDGVSSMMICRLFRNATGANDTYEHDAGLLEFDVHYQVDQLGSATITTH